MQVIRIEHPSTGHGPYRSNRQCLEILNREFEAARQPTIQDDFPRELLDVVDSQFDHSRHMFGFRDSSQCVRWFNDRERQAIIDAGFAVNVYEVPDAWQGNSQVVFDIRAAKLVAHIHPDRFLSGDLNMLLAAEQENDPHK